MIMVMRGVLATSQAEIKNRDDWDTGAVEDKNGDDGDSGKHGPAGEAAMANESHEAPPASSDRTNGDSKTGQ